MVTYLPRSAWTSTARGGAVQDGSELVGLVAHYTGVTRTYRGLSRSGVASVLRSIRNHHVNNRGWADVGYSAAVDHAGRVWDLRGITRVPAAHASAANPRANWHRSAVLLLLGANEEPSDEMVEAFRDFRTNRWLDRWPNATDLLGHRDVPGAATACPGNPVAGHIADGTLLGSGGGSGGGTVTVQSGDTLTAIASAHGTTVDALVAANGIADPDVIHPGQTLTIPTSSGGGGGSGSGGHEPGTRMLRLRSPMLRGPDVTFVQRWIGPPAGPADGIYGPKTRSGVRWYQDMRGITVDGIVGEQTWGEMNVQWRG